MDNTKEYIKMCREAKEIQKLWNFDDGDFYINNIYIDKEVITSLCCMCNVKDSYGDTVINEYTQKDFIWLPRQDQLQEILSNMVIAGRLMDDEYWRQFRTMEQLWLAFVMKENYNKVWNGEEWVKNI